jgi:hypothetical protein
MERGMGMERVGLPKQPADPAGSPRRLVATHHIAREVPERRELPPTERAGLGSSDPGKPFHRLIRFSGSEKKRKSPV